MNMKTKTSIKLISLLLFFCMSTMAQTVLVVEPGIGTLNRAIDTYKGSRIYELKAGEWYQLSAIVENVDYHLQIRGQEPVNGGMPATLQTGTDAAGAVLFMMFAPKGDITLKNIYLVNADLLGVTATWFMTNSKKSSRTIIDHCIIDPVCQASGISFEESDSKTYFTNNLCIRAGHQLSPNDGFMFVTQNNSGAGFDSLLVQNNTFVCMGTGMHAGNFNVVVDNFSKWDHNTFVEQKSQIDWQNWEREYYWTNNLMFDMQTQPWSPSWDPMPGADKAYPTSSMIYADTIPGDVLPSNTVQFVEYNMHYRNPKFYTMINELNAQGKIDGKTTVLSYQPLVWPIDSARVSRETNMFANNTSFPLWKYGNTTNNIDPQWGDSRIYTMSDNFVAWTRPATMVHAMNYPPNSLPAASTWTQWHWDPDGDISNNSTWPVFNGVYNNAAMLIGSIEGLPLGDLNWFPEAKALWTRNKQRIDDHMRAAVESKLDMISGVKSLNLSDIKTTCYPNPFSNDLTISYSVKNQASVKLTILALNGKTVAELVNQTKAAGEYTSKWNGKSFDGEALPNGLYLYRLQIGNEVASARVLKLK